MAIERHKNTLDYERRALGTLAEELSETDNKLSAMFKPVQAKSRNPIKEYESALSMLSQRAPSFITDSTNKSKLNRNRIRLDEKRYEITRNNA